MAISHADEPVRRGGDRDGAGRPVEGVPEDDPIAVVAVGCRLPGGASRPEDVWELLAAGRDATTEMPADRGWDHDTLFDPEPRKAAKTYVTRGGFLRDAGEFEAEFFGISPREALAVDPQQRLLLETAWEALERAGIEPGSLRGTRTGVFVGTSYSGYGPQWHLAPSEIKGFALAGSIVSAASGRLAFTLGLNGPTMTIDTACSSSLVALHLAAHSLRRGECPLALAGGAAVWGLPGLFVEFSQRRGLAPDGRCKPFSATADGTAWGEAVGMLVLERLSDARSNRHPVLALIRGSAVNQDGASPTLSSPSRTAQRDVIRQALADAGLRAAEIDLLEAHGTGTQIGDSIEAKAVFEAYGADRATGRPLWMGSLKSNIGHAAMASGVAGVIKALLALEHGVMPRTLHVGEPTGRVDWSSGAVRVLTEATPWPEVPGPRRAAVSSFGLTGTNAHLILEQAPPSPRAATPGPVTVVTGPEAAAAAPWLVSARGEWSLRTQATRLNDYLAAHPDVDPDDVANRLLISRTTTFEHRAVLLGRTRADIVRALDALASGRPDEDLVCGVAGRTACRPVFVFPGQGGQWAGMGARLLGGGDAGFAADIARCADAFAEFFDWSLPDVLAGRGAAGALDEDGIVQPALFAVMVALAGLWRRSGIEPEAVIGHSQGEIAAAHVAGALSLRDAARILAARAAATAALAGRGAMVGVALSARQAEQLFLGPSSAGRLSIAALNGPNSVVLSGDPDAVADVLARCEAQGIRARKLPVGYAAHSGQIEAVRDSFLRDIAGIEPAVSPIPFFSTVTGARLDTAELTADYWYRNLRETVRFEPAAHAALALRQVVFVEPSPHPTLGAALADIMDAAAAEPGVVVTTLRRDDGGPDRVRRSLAEAHVCGLPVTWAATSRTGSAVPAVDLPTYPFDRQHYWWIDPAAGSARMKAAQTVLLDDADAVTRGAAASPSDPWRYRIGWQPVTATSVAVLRDVWLLVEPDNQATAAAQATTAIARALRLRGARVVLVTVDPSGDEAARIAERLIAAQNSEVADGRIAGVLSLLAQASAPHSQHPAVSVGLAATVALLNALERAGIDAPVWCTTRGAVAVDGSDHAPDPVQAAVWGLGRVAALEQTLRWGGLVDLPPAEPDERTLRQLCAVLAGLGGEDQVALRASGVHSRRLLPAGDTSPTDAPTPHETLWQPGGTVLITGGTGALGAHLARRLARRGTEHLVLVSRRGADAAGAEDLVAELNALGAKATVAACDVSDRAALSALFDSLPSMVPSPLTAVVHTAGVLQDALLESLDVGGLAAVLAPKAAAARHLDELTRALPLSAFVLFSSASGVLGQPGQANYAAANAYLDALAERRRAEGLPATSIAWGGWDGPGLAGSGAASAGLRRGGITLMPPDAALDAWERAVDDDEPALMIADVDWPAFVPAFTAARPSRLIEGVPQARRLAEAERAVRDRDTWGARLAGVPRAERERLLLSLVRECAARVLRQGSAEKVRPSTPFREAGFDSVGAVDLRNQLGAATGLRLASTLVYEHPTPALLAEHLAAELAAPDARAAAPQHEESPQDTAPAGPAESTASAAPESQRTDPVREPIAITAMACRFPGGASTPEALWQLLVDGTDAISPLPDRRGWPVETMYDPDLSRPGTSRTRQGGFLHEADEFDAAFFGISPREALTMDPQQRLALETAWEAVERAGIDPATLRGTPTGTFLGCTATDYGSDVRRVPAGLEGHLMTGTFASVISGRVAYTLGLSGPAVTVDSACSSSLVALHLAAQALRSGDCAMALAGGVTVMSTPTAFTGMSRQGALAADGRCKAFSADADGMGMAEGIGVLLLERLSDAVRGGRPILALLRGSAINQDGASNGLTAPSGPAQQQVIRRALAAARLSPGEVDAVEAHGTGTVLGDPIEAHALLRVYGRDRPADQPLWLGTVKSNIGHSAAAAGVAGVIKMVLALQHGLLPRTLHAERPSPEIAWSRGAVALLAEARPWPDHGRPRRAAVSSFGISGTNAHAILEQAPAPTQDPASRADDEPADANADTRPASTALLPWLLSGRTGAALRARAADLLDHLDARPGPAGPGELAHALATTRTAFDERAAVLGSTRADLERGLRALATDAAADNVLRSTAVEPGAGVVFVFPGQGSQWDGMARGLMNRHSVFAETIGRCGAALERYTDWSLEGVLDGSSGDGALASSRVDVVQPCLWAVMLGLAAVWRDAGVEPRAVIGHSQGEIAAAHVAGALTLDDAARAIALRSRAMLGLAGQGGMASVALAADALEDRIERFGARPAGRIAGRLAIAAVNGPATTVISGDPEAVEDFVEACSADGVWARHIAVDYASHSHHIEPLRGTLLAELGPMRPRSRGALPFYSTVSGVMQNPATLDAEYWYRNLRHTVRFEPAVRALISAGYRHFVEVSPHPVLGAAISDTLAAAKVEGAVVGTLRRDDGGPDRITAALAEAHVKGLRPDWASALDGHRGTRHVPLPTYPFQRERHWLRTDPECAAEPAHVAAVSGVPGAAQAAETDDRHPLLPTELPLAGSGGLVLAGRLAPAEQPWTAEHVLGGIPVLAATAFVELADHAAARLGHPVVEELILHAPLIVPGAVALQLVVDAADGFGRRSLGIYARPEPEPEPKPATEPATRTTKSDPAWTRHASAVLAPAAEPPTAPPDLGTWPPPEAQPIELARHYEMLAEAGVGYGPTFHGLTRVWRTTDGICAEAALPAAGHEDADALFGLHPALLDTAFQALAYSAAPADGGLPGPVRASMPFSFSGVTLYATGARDLRIRMIRDEIGAVTVHVFDPAGRPVLAIDELVLREVPDPAAVAQMLRHPPAESLSRSSSTAAIRPRVLPKAAQQSANAGPSDPQAWRLGGASGSDGLDGPAQERAALDLVRTHAAAALRHRDPGAVPPDRAFKDLGFDSVSAVDLRDRLYVATGVRLPATAVFDHPTAAQLAERLRVELFGAASAGGAAQDTDTPATPATAATAATAATTSTAATSAAGIGGATDPDLDPDLDLDLALASDLAPAIDDDLRTATDEELFALIEREFGRS